MKNKESKIQAEIVKYLQSKKYFFASIPNELGGKDAAIRMAKFKTLGLRSGAPDLLVFLPAGKLICLEVKTETGKQSDSQIAFEQKLSDLGFDYFVVRSVEDVKNILDKFL